MFKSLNLARTVPVNYEDLLSNLQAASRAADLTILRSGGAPADEIESAEKALEKIQSSETLKIVVPEPITVTSKSGVTYQEAPVCVRTSSGTLMELELEGPPTIMSGGFTLGKFAQPGAPKYQVTLNISPGKKVYPIGQRLPEDPQSQEHAIFYGVPPAEDSGLSEFPEHASIIDLITWQQYRSMLTLKPKGVNPGDIGSLRVAMGSDAKPHHSAVSWKQSRMYVDVKCRVSATDPKKAVKCKVIEDDREIPFEALIGHPDTDFVIIPVFSFRVHKSKFMSISPTLVRVFILERRTKKTVKTSERLQRLRAAYQKSDAPAAAAEAPRTIGTEPTEVDPSETGSSAHDDVPEL